jgi:hypothetical protein
MISFITGPKKMLECRTVAPMVCDDSDSDSDDDDDIIMRALTATVDEASGASDEEAAATDEAEKGHGGPPALEQKQHT